MEELIVCGNVHVPVWCPKRSELPAWWWGTVGGGYNNRILWGALLLRQGISGTQMPLAHNQNPS